MPRGPSRPRVLLEDILELGPPAAKNARSIFHTTDEKFFFSIGAAAALLYRLRRKDPKEAETALEAINLVRDYGWELFREKGLENAAENVFALAASLSSRDISRVRRSKPIVLLKEWWDIVDMLEREGFKEWSYDKRKRWLKEKGKMREEEAERLADESPPVVAEHMLARQHGISQSRLHKTLAEARRSLKALRSRRL